MSIVVNGEARSLAPEVATVADLLQALGYRAAFVAVAINRSCVRRPDFANTPVHAGDEVEILAPMAGG
jgi:sulfur carrier protein